MASKQEKIKQRIEDYIRDSGIGQGEKLPPETVLAQAFQVSRTTVRGAIQRLESEGKLLVKHGSGTFITRPLPAIPSSLDRLYSIGDMIRSAGLQEDEQLEYIKRLDSCPHDIAEPMELRRQDPVIVLERTRTANGEAVAHSINYMPEQIAEAILVDGSFAGSLFQNLEYKAGVRIVGAYSEITVPSRTDLHARRLITSPQSAVLLFKQLHYDELNRQVLYSFDYVRSDIFQFWIRRNR
ncbi:GntR family transcriptional regulator [Paenibacillus sp. P96]|uniref:GntR family transcriptional regulator n=1 Tax=Paenibacillus zeirhizosphaerae TaxID=2987519 RepID=A0ABT9FTT5_9BACL|nr:GntR family transcriptional regulator [Paenibacillus sp. P96]MDP4098131.1 GntR family transcriptional regulator [Paenibacillus sp. P96]